MMRRIFKTITGFEPIVKKIVRIDVRQLKLKTRSVNRCHGNRAGGSNDLPISKNAGMEFRNRRWYRIYDWTKHSLD